jgi:hypothetical protein
MNQADKLVEKDEPGAMPRAGWEKRCKLRRASSTRGRRDGDVLRLAAASRAPTTDVVFAVVAPFRSALVDYLGFTHPAGARKPASTTLWTVVI